MKKLLYPFVAFFAVLFILVAFNQQLTSDKGKVLSSTTSAKEEKQAVKQEAVLSPMQQDAVYRDSVRTFYPVLKALVEPISESSDLEKRQNAANGLKESLLELKVPQQYQSLHLGMVLAADNLVKLYSGAALSGNANIDFSEVDASLSNLVEANSWLTAK